MPPTESSDMFSVVPLQNESDWNQLRARCDSYLTQANINQLRSLVGHSCKTVIVERDYYCKDYRDTFAHYYSKKFAQYPGTCHRLLFFEDAIDEGQLWDVPSYRSGFIGYSVIRPNRTSPIGRTFLDPTKCAGVHGYLCLVDHTAHMLGYPLTISGFPFISQDTDVTICAHAACWMCFRYFSSKYQNYSEIYPYQITQLTDYLYEGRLIPSQGLKVEQMVEIISRYGFFPRVYVRSVWDKPDGNEAEAGLFDRLLYSYIESGLPVILSLPRHAVTCFGHNSDLTIAPQNAGTLYSSFYMTGVIINDDNFMPYQSLAVAGKPSAHHTSGYVLSDVNAFIVPLPEEVYLAAEDVERLTYLILTDRTIGLAADSLLSVNNLVIRLFLTTANSYKEYRRMHGMPHKIEEMYAKMPMSRFIWVAELSTHEEYPDGRVLGEILFDATASARDPYAFLTIHYPERLIINDRHSHLIGLKQLRLSLGIGYDIYRHNLHEV